jgi:NAD(P)-dependent dehydrogenase (short-subunit alcohol dehydrogenase family)
MTGIGLATATAFALSGCSSIVLLDISQSNLDSARSKILGKLSEHKLPQISIECIHCDVSNHESIAGAYASIVEKLGRIDYSVHCAGVFIPGGPTADCSVEDFDRQNAVAYRGLWLCSKEALKVMKAQTLDCEAYPDAGIPEGRAQRGAIVNISSQLAKGWQENAPAYIAAKAAVIALTHCDALDYVDHRIRVNCVLPGIVETPMSTPTPELRKYMVEGPVAKTPMKRFGQPEEVADAIVFLAGNRSSFMTGTEVTVDGGYSAR